MNLFTFFNQSVNNFVATHLIQRRYKSHGRKRTIEFIERLKNVSSNLSRKVSISLGLKEALTFKEQRLIFRQNKQQVKKRKLYKDYTIENLILLNARKVSDGIFTNVLLEILNNENPLNPFSLISFFG